MLIEESIRRQEELKKCLFEMASVSMPDADIRKKVIELKTLYSDGFRHNYSMFFPLIVEIAERQEEYSLDYLATNLEDARALVERDYIAGEKEFKGLYKPLSKLSDHINLESARYIHYSVREQKVLDLEKQNSDLQAHLIRATKELSTAKKKVERVQTELISVLSIFAAIVFTFSGSLSFLGQALTGMAEAPFFKSVFFVLLCGIIIFNTIFVMLYVVGKITGKSIYMACKKNYCNCTDEGKKGCSGIQRFCRKLPYVFWINVLWLFLLVVDMIFWILNTYYCFLPV